MQVIVALKAVLAVIFIVLPLALLAYGFGTLFQNRMLRNRTFY